MVKLLLWWLLIAPAFAQTSNYVIVPSWNTTGCATNRIVADGSYVPASGYTLLPDDGRMLCQQQAGQALAGGLSVTSTSGGFTAPFGGDSQTQANIAVEQVSLLVGGTFTNGATTIQWPDLLGVWHSLSTTQFVVMAKSVAAWVTALNLYAGGAPGSALPANTATIP